VYEELSTLIKLQKTHVDEQRQHLARLQERLDYIEGKIAEVEIRKAGTGGSRTRR